MTASLVGYFHVPFDTQDVPYFLVGDDIPDKAIQRREWEKDQGKARIKLQRRKSCVE